MNKTDGQTASARAAEADRAFALGEQAPPFWTCAGIKLRLRSANWLSDIFAQEFGVSDVQANYTRVYAWMANQLGHMTLGLAGALLFVWIAETVSSLLEYYAAKMGITGAATKTCQWGWWCGFSNTLLFLTVAGILGGVTYAFYKKMQTKMQTNRQESAQEATKPDPSLKDRKTIGFPPISPKVAWWTYLAMPILLFGVIIGAMLRMYYDGALSGIAEQGGLLAATVVIAAAIVFLCKDAEVLAISLPAMAIVLIMGTGVWNIPATGLIDLWVLELVIMWEFVAVLGLTALLVLMLYWLRYADKAYDAMRVRGAKKIREYFGLAFFAVFLAIFACGLQEDWRLALTAAFASTTLWWVKEFGSDIPGVHQEISRARAKRPPLLDDAPPATVKDFDSVELDYMTDARMDARTDGLFYIAGAWIGAGIISGRPVLSDLSWATGAELVGCLVFILIFLLEGKRWSYRQVALDRMGATRASRLAVFHSAIKMTILEPGEAVSYRRGDAGPALDRWQADPITQLDDFARATEPKGHTRIDHIIVFGPMGSGRTPLGLAIASEASLASLSTADDGKVITRIGDARRGRYLRMQRLSHLLERAHEVSELMGFPTKPVWFNKQGERVAADADDADREEKSADIVVIDDVNMDIVPLDKACAQLNLAEGQQTVWMLGVKDPSKYEPMTTEADLRNWQPDHQSELMEIATIQNQLEKETPGRGQRIALIFVRPYLAKGAVKTELSKAETAVIPSEVMEND